jgi:hypothetical protein
LEYILYIDQAVELAPNLSLERFLELVANDKHKLAESDTNGVIDRIIDDRLTAGGFRRIGQPTIVVLKGDLPMEKERIMGRNYVLATLADCDQDFAVYD